MGMNGRVIQPSPHNQYLGEASSRAKNKSWSYYYVAKYKLINWVSIKAVQQQIKLYLY